MSVDEAFKRYLPGRALKQRGRKLWACCPFHGEKTPSFAIDTIKQKAHCFGCGWHGDGIDIALKVMGWTIHQLAADLGVVAGNEISQEYRTYLDDRRTQAKLITAYDAALPQAIQQLKAIRDAVTDKLKQFRPDDEEDKTLWGLVSLRNKVESIIDALMENDISRQLQALHQAGEVIKLWRT